MTLKTYLSSGINDSLADIGIPRPVYQIKSENLEERYISVCQKKEVFLFKEVKHHTWLIM